MNVWLALNVRVVYNSDTIWISIIMFQIPTLELKKHKKVSVVFHERLQILSVSRILYLVSGILEFYLYLKFCIWYLEFFIQGFHQHLTKLGQLNWLDKTFSTLWLEAPNMEFYWNRRQTAEFVKVFLSLSDNKTSTVNTEAVAQRCSVKKVLIVISQNSQENTHARVSCLIKLQIEGSIFIKK